MKGTDTIQPPDEKSSKRENEKPREPEKVDIIENVTVIDNNADFEEEIISVKFKRESKSSKVSETGEYIQSHRTYNQQNQGTAEDDLLPETKNIIDAQKIHEPIEEKIVDEPDSTLENDEKDDNSEEWDGSEAEIVLDDEAEEYEEEVTGIKIKYTLRSNEIKEYIKHSESYQKNRKSQRKHTVIQGIIFAAMIGLSFLLHNNHYLWLTLFPIAAILLIWIVPFFKIKQIISEMFKKEEISVEIFPDKIEVQRKDYEQEIPLDGSCESEEYENLILIFSKSGLNLIIPLRAIEPEFLADVQAMIFAGAKPRYKD